MSEEQHGREKRCELNHVGNVRSPSSQDAVVANPPAGHSYASISVYGGGQNQFGDNITINQSVNCDHYNIDVGQARKDEILIESLTFERMDARSANIATALPETCQWVFTHPHFQVWEGDTQSPEHRTFLWLKGKPGCGKSTIMKLLCSRASKTSANQVGLTYFFNARAPGLLEKSSLGLCRSLTYQLLTALPRTRPNFLNRFRSKVRGQKVEEWATAELKDFLIAAFTQPNLPSIVIFVDALDEGAESDVRNLITFFEGVQHHVYVANASLRICFSSRHYPHITIRAGLEIVVEQQIGHNTDMMRYIRWNLHGDQSPSMDELRRKVHQKSGGIFLWVILVVPMLNNIFDRGKSPEDARKRLEDIPEELDALFCEILAKSHEDIDECVSLLQWVAFAMEPLTPQQLYLALRYSQTTTPVARPTVPESERVAKYLLHCSRGLIEVTQSNPSQVQFIHETIRSFLLSERGLAKVKPRLEMDVEGTSHDKLKEVCLRYIMDQDLTRLKRADLMLQSPTAPIRLLRYASACLFPHADAAQKCGQSQLDFVTAIEEDRNNIVTIFKQCHNLCSPSHNCYPCEVTPLQIAAEQNLFDLAQCIISHGADVNAKGGGYGNALYAASRRGHLRMVQSLLDRGADINAVGGEHGNALHVASVKGYLQVVMLLLDRGADVNKLSRSRSALQAAVLDHGKPEIIQLLLDRGASANAIEGEADSALQAASYRDQSEIVQLLLDQGADINATGRRWGNALHAAIRANNLYIVQLLVERGADLNKRCGDGYSSALILARVRESYSPFDTSITEFLKTREHDKARDDRNRIARELEHVHQTIFTHKTFEDYYRYDWR